MFCSQCGKKVMDSMIFCPFCGSPIVIPGQQADTSSGQTPKEEEIQLALPKRSPRNESKGFEPLNLEIDWSCEEVRPLLDPEEDNSEFEPLDLSVDEVSEDESEHETPKEADGADISGEISELLSRQLREEPVQLQGHVPNLTSVRSPEAGRRDNRRKADTHAPVRAFNPENIFMDSEDDYDEDEDEDYIYEDAESGGFFIRHIRGMVALALFLVVMAIVVGWTLSSAGQTTLAQANLAWRPQAYEKLGYEAYQNSQYALAAEYYARALQRDSDNFSDAYSAGVAYYRDGNVEKAAEMGRRAVEIAPSRADGYLLLQRLYSDASSRPWEIQQLLQQGYQLTGDESLNDASPSA